MSRDSGVVRLVLSGYYGFRNSGDEAVLKSILTALEQAGRERGVQVEPVVLSADPEWTSRQYGVESVPRMKLAKVRNALRNSDGLISGGGSLLQDATGLGSIPYYLGIMEMARWSGKPTFVYAQGIGPVQRGIFKWPIARAFRKAAYVSVRDEESAALLRRFGVPEARIDVVPDPVMGLPLADAADSGGADGSDARPVVGVSVRFWRGDRADLDRVAAALAMLAGRRSVRLRFLPFHHGPDEDASRYVMERLSAGAAASGGEPVCELAPAHEDPQAMLREVSRCRLLVGMRLHSLIYAANREVPLLGLSYDPKIDQFLNRLGETAVGSTESLDPGDFAQRAATLLDNPQEWRTRASSAIERLKNEAVRPAKQILDYLR
ncbi:polysaccharide pyruvyl transferase CsaB [Cohnella pontilimi]|uniref:Polysaccharide pyruvyl transferase CsaB n=1 Tax=Cohnella pontilimi TaxID=2564100 RepID=A0A4U0FAT3_9BACL|nr:polysaccharide pyruvyl transferase CsaB [Cohnella pontilimi]TJY41923.1 polysaccharide pyruvyl transferase CsaB [Cohnella pontilimi]